MLRGALGAGALLAFPALPACSGENESDERKVFLHGVASGDPLADAVILWTRVTASGPVEVSWEVAADPGFAAPVGGGSLTTDAERDHTVKIDAKGLEAGKTYYYRFRALGETSPIGRTRTAPVTAARLRFAVVSCSNFAHGYFHVYRALSERADLDAVLHLGDYIYEYESDRYGEVRPCEPKHEIVTLADYRLRHAQYKRDPDSQAAHRQHPFICTWDDHESANDAWRGGAENHEAEDGDWQARKAAAARAYEEWMPVRSIEGGRLWRALRYGDLADLLVLDTRIWGRDEQAKGEKDPSLADDARQLLGADQEAWLFEELRTSKARWKLVCQQVMMAQLPQFLNTDQWDGYPKARERLYDVLEKTPVNDVVVLTGDIHSSWASDLARTPKDPATYDPATGRGSLAVEMVTPAVSSPGFPPQLAGVAEGIAKDNPWMKFVDLVRRGFVLVDLDASRAQGAYFHVQDVVTPDPMPATFSAAVATYAGENRLRREDAAAEARADAPPLAP